MIFPTLPSAYHFLEREKHWQHFWTENQLYNWDPTADRQATFAVDTPPPTVSGQLHIGHACSYAQTDFMVRFQRMLGKNIFYPMGFDDNGLPTERLVEKQKGIRAAHTERADFTQLCQEVILETEGKFRNLFKAIGLSIDWNLEYQTISPLSCKLSQMSFLDLLAKGAIYRSEEPILWDPVDGTALAQADLEEKVRMTYMHDILFRHATTQAPLWVATTRPELLPACVALFYHPDDTRYQHLADSTACTPFFSIQVPILADSSVQPEKGTGLVMCCTFGDQTDVAWWKQHQLPTQIILNKAGIITASHAAPLQGLTVAKARESMIHILKEKGLLGNQTTFLQSVKCAERSGAVVEILTTPQWFVRTMVHKEALLAKVAQLQWYPPSMKHKLETWIHGIAWDWCISRQRYFGIPFPIWHSKRAGEEGKILVPEIHQLPVDPLKALPLGYTREEVTADYDVMDTWATSSISPQLSTHAINASFSINYVRHTQLFPMDLRPQAHEIIRTWTFYTLLKAHLHEDSLPWKNIMIQGWCLAPDKNKMSKSKGNVILPEKVLQQYGADVLRYWSAYARLGTDTSYCENVMKNGKRVVTKLWNAGKFIAPHISQLSAGCLSDMAATTDCITHTLDKWLVQTAREVEEQVHASFKAYNYTEALLLIERFFWSIFCDDYLEISKIRVYNSATAWSQQEQQSAKATLYHIFYFLLQLFAPILPYITEELAQGLYPDRGSIHKRGNWPQKKFAIFLTPDQLTQVTQLREIVSLVRKAKADRKLSIKAAIQILTIQGIALESDLLQDLQAVTATETVRLNAHHPAAIEVVGKHCKVGIVWA